jgi:hypothetical protein
LGSEMFQRLQICQNLSRKITREHNDNSNEESTKYFNLKVKSVNFKEDDSVLMKEHNFMHKNRKLAETFKGPFKITKVLLIRTKPSKHNHLVNTNLLVKYNAPPSFEHHQNNQDQIGEEISKRKYQKRIFKARPDGGPVT